jgi:predicted signal transduction protein with EAL and GGDEF domain
LKALGVRLSIDDFGTGYSSLSRLRRIPVDTLKIDRAFISHMDSDPESREIVRTIIMLAHNLGLKVVAEGSETEEHVNLLKQLNCEMAQGYFFSRPADDQAMLKLLAGNTVLAAATVITCDPQVGNGIRFVKMLPEDRKTLEAFLDAAQQAQDSVPQGVGANVSAS